jgi:hypothetical protein
MSYEPTLVVNRKHLIDKEREIESDSYEYPDDHSIQYIASLLRKPYASLSGVEFIICNPEGTMFNKLVREQLYEYDIEFAEDI